MVMAHDFSVRGLAPTPTRSEPARISSRRVAVAVENIPIKLSVDELMRPIAQDKKVKRGEFTFI